MNDSLRYLADLARFSTWPGFFAQLDTEQVTLLDSLPGGSLFFWRWVNREVYEADKRTSTEAKRVK